MKQYKVTVNGVAYEVTVEELSESAPAVQAAPASAPASVPNVVHAPAAAPAGGFRLTAPMPGTVIDIKVAVGDVVQKGDAGLILEAMKMENEIFIPASGKVVSVNVVKGAAVKSGDLLLVIA
ncbi:MAG: biotin/lipoyl-binding protein [Firmicutes bacterium]|nr:biotin/lipoyl-binding protein [Bacillota bacterium]